MCGGLWPRAVRRPQFATASPGYPIWHGLLAVGTGWNQFDAIWPVGQGMVYARVPKTLGEVVVSRVHEQVADGLGGMDNPAVNEVEQARLDSGWSGSAG